MQLFFLSFNIFIIILYNSWNGAHTESDKNTRHSRLLNRLQDTKVKVSYRKKIHTNVATCAFPICFWAPPDFRHP